LADSDAKIVLIASSRAPVDRSSVVRANEIEETIRAVLVYHDNHAVLGRRYPRLCEYLGDPKSKRIDPNLEGRVRYTNLLDFSLDATRFKRGYEPLPQPGDFAVGAVDEAAVDGSARLRALASQPCTEVKGEQRFADDALWVPSWHQSETKSKKEQAYGLAATAYSLAGTVYRMVTSEEILSELERPGENGRQGRRLLAVATEMARLNKLGLPKEHLYTVLLDGDSFKELFVETPGLRRSGLSVRTELDLRHRWFDALRQLVEAKELEYLPVDLTYLGGDDLAFSLPKEHFPEFLECLAKSKPPGDLDLTYSFVAVERPARDPEAEVTAKAEEESEGDSQEEAARPDKLARKLLALVKLKRKEEPEEGQQVQLDIDGELKTVEWLGDGAFQGVIYPLPGDNH